MKRRALALAVLIAVALVSAVAVVQAKHRARQLQAQLQEQRAQRDQLKSEWAQLQLEESAWANPGRVAQMAREQLQMRQPKDTVVVKAQP